MKKLSEFNVYSESYELFRHTAPVIAAFCADRIIRSAAWLKSEAKNTEHYAQAKKTCSVWARRFALKYLFSSSVPLKLRISRLMLYYLPLTYDVIMRINGG